MKKWKNKTDISAKVRALYSFSFVYCNLITINNMKIMPQQLQQLNYYVHTNADYKSARKSVSYMRYNCSSVT